MFWTALIALPLISGLQRYGVAYGYQGVSRAEAWHSAKFAAIGMAAFVCLPVALWRLL